MNRQTPFSSSQIREIQERVIQTQQLFHSEVKTLLIPIPIPFVVTCGLERFQLVKSKAKT